MNSLTSRFLPITLAAFMGLGVILPVQAAEEPQNPAQEPGVTVATSTAAAENQNPRLQNSYVEAGGDYLRLTNNFGSWSGGYMRATLSTPTDVWNGEINGQREFGDAGVFAALGDSHTFNSDWYGSVTVGSSAGGFFWPRYRLDGFINRKALRRKQWITSAGFGYYAAKDAHRDRSFALGSTYYFDRPWVLEAGLRFNISNPGAVFSPSGFVAVTEGREKHHYLVVRLGMGVEAYQLVGASNTLTNFQSRTLTVTWRRWVGKNWGFNLVGDYYGNPSYTRAGSTLGIFKNF